jgi:predicted  nucleic acid-binding Zn-ribbon protein
MNRHMSMGILAVALSALLLQAAPGAAQTPAPTATKQVTDASETLKNYSVEKKNEAVAYSKKLVSDLDVKIKDLETQISKDTSAAGADAKRQGKELKELTDLKAARAQAAKKSDEMGKASKESWDGAKQAFADSYKDLTKAYDAAAAKVKK